MTFPTGYANFYHSDKVTIQLVRFQNPYGIDIAGNLVLPKDFAAKNGKAKAIVVGHPLGAVKEQAAMLYAQVLAEQGFATLAIDLPFWAKAAATRVRPLNQRFTPTPSTAPWITSIPATTSTPPTSPCSASAPAAAMCWTRKN